MEKVYIQWTIVNWITVVLMVSIGYLLIGLVGQAYQKWGAQ